MGKTSDEPHRPIMVTGSPVASFGPTADFYRERAEQLAVSCAQAMRRGDISLANQLYERGVNARITYLWNRRMAQCVGSDFTIMKGR